MAGFPQRILLAVDGSQQSDLALDHVVDLVRATGAELHVLHVGLVSPWTTPRNLGPQQESRLRAEAQAVLDAHVTTLAAEGVQPAGVHLRLGRATDEILRLRDEIEADLIVMGGRGLNAFTRVLLGSDAAGVVRHAPCAVLVVRREQ